ncbi:hypothetical protein ABEB36_003196 [Hypothenemus hampei]|uniref:Dynein attachment factor N-terminal domain-containing protein n=1 Tax=Hypothenemus hampei TaxID=57062 RepID=A0ABD1F8D3_HYPHA
MASSNSKKQLEFLYSQLQSDLESDTRYWLRNDAKLKAVVTAKSYEEFRESVDAAHLQPLSKQDIKKTTKTNWNKALQ